MFDSRDPIIELNITKTHVENELQDLLVAMKGFKFQITLEITFRETEYLPPIYFNCKTHTVVNDLDIDNSLKISYQIILSKLAW